MARDSLTALVALNRFGFGARGGASGDFVNAASDPRGFVKAELARPSGALLEVPGLQSTPALAHAVFEYQDQVRQAREQAAKSAPSEAAPPLPTEAKQQQRRGLSLDIAAKDIGGQASTMKAQDNAGANPPMAAGEAMQSNVMQPNAATAPNAEKPPQQPLNIIQKTFRAEA
jgi:uncharacterized protein (DUF1800 family)